MGYKYTTYSVCGSSRLFNEDALEVLELKDGKLFILCDGMGSGKDTEFASSLAVKFITSYFNYDDETDYLEKLKNAVTEANDFIYNYLQKVNGKKKIATTIELFYLKDNVAYIAHVGDSRIYLYKNGNLRLMTKDHSLVQKLVDEGFISVLEAENHPEKNTVTNAIGFEGFIQSDLIKLKLNEYDENKFFICTDGVTNVLSDNEISKLLKRCSADNIIFNIEDAIKTRNVNDDFSFIYIEKDK